MSELYKAMKRIEDYKSTKPLGKQIAEIKGMASTARYGYDIQPQLTIPKSIADELDSDNLLDFVDRVLTASNLPKSSARYDYSQTCKYWYYAMVAYLNPLTHDLVKVVEG